MNALRSYESFDAADPQRLEMPPLILDGLSPLPGDEHTFMA